jgi:tryptophan 2,3-dioxygenase
MKQQNNLSDYEKYIRTEELLNLQKKEEELCCEDELTFQMVHQIAELHFKLILQYLDLAKKHMENREIIEATAQMKRVNLQVKHVPEVFSMTKVISPRDYHTIRLSLGQGSGQDSPGFNAILKEGPTLWEPFAKLLENRNLTALELHKTFRENFDLYELMKEMNQFDESFQSFRYHHFQIVRRMIGINTNSLKGVPAQMLQKGMRQEFYPELWQAVCELTDWTGSSYDAKPLED